MSFVKSSTKVTIIVNFIVVDQPSFYDTILGRSTLYAIKATTSIYHYALKFLTRTGGGIVREEKKEARECYKIVFR